LHAIAAIFTVHAEMISPVQIMDMYGSSIYKVRDGLMDNVTMEHVVAPDLDFLRAKHAVSTESDKIAAFLTQGAANNAGNEEPFVCHAPKRRDSESHGNSQ
jgi:hypothetical protein